MEYVSADHIATVGGGGRFEPQRTNNFTIRFSPPAGVGGANAAEIFALSVHQIPFPNAEGAVIEIPFGNEVRKVSGRWTYSNETLQIKDFVGAETSRVIDAWSRKVYDPETGKISWAHQYKVNAEMLFFGPDGTQPRTWQLIGMWPRRVKYGEGNMASPNNNMIEVEFAVDKIKYLG